MGITVNLNEAFVNFAKSHSTVQSRSMPKQIEHWARIGCVAEENPDLSYNVIKDIFLGIEDVKNGNLTEYKEDSL